MAAAVAGRPAARADASRAQPGAEREIQAADPRLRRLAFVTFLLATCLGAGLIAWLEAERPALQRWLLDAPPARAQLVFRALALALTLPLLLGAARALRIARRTLEAERFPPPGLAVVRDTPVRRGAAARRWGRALRVVALALGVLGGAIALLLWRIAGWLV